VQRSYRRKPGLPPVLERFVADPVSGLAEVVALLRVYWERTLAPHWPRVRALLEGDVLHRARQMADGGAERLFADVDPTVSWADGVLSIDKGSVEQDVDLRDRGLLFVPSAFAWPDVVLVTDPRWQPTLVYPARGVGTLWEADRPAAPEALGALLGRVRAAVLMALDHPRSTTDLARSLGVSAGGVSQHLGILRAAGLVHGHRVGRVVLYLRSPAGDGLVGARLAQRGLPRTAAAALAREDDALDLEQRDLAVQAAGVAGEAAARADDAVAGHHDRDRVGAQRAAGGA
jgi:DNA-binding transcriptional ArsR family regulator